MFFLFLLAFLYRNFKNGRLTVLYFNITCQMTTTVQLRGLKHSCVIGKLQGFIHAQDSPQKDLISGMF